MRCSAPALRPGLKSPLRRGLWRHARPLAVPDHGPQFCGPSIARRRGPGACAGDECRGDDGGRADGKGGLRRFCGRLLGRVLGDDARTNAAKLPLLLTSASLLPIFPAGSWSALKSNNIFMAGFWAWAMAQLLKIVTNWYKTGEFELMAMFYSGGMPSSHSALCTAVTTAVGMTQGVGCPLFAVALAFSAIVLYDAAGIRRHAGYQAEVLNIILSEYPDGHVLAQRKALKEVLGHSRRQVAVGLVLGVLVGLLFS